MCTNAHAEQINLHWLNADGSTYSESTCTVNGDLIIPSTPPTKYGYTFTGWKIENYIPIEYLESTGTQYIDTAYSASNGFLSQIKLMILNNKRSAIFGSHNPTEPYGRNDLLLATGGSYSFEIGADYVHITNFYPNSNQIYDVTLSTVKNDVFFSVKEPYFYSEYKNASYLSSNNLYLFDVNGYTFDNFIGRIYSCKIYDNDVLVRDFIPVLDSNDTPCMFDKVEGKFYYNAGTGDFIAGPVIGW